MFFKRKQLRDQFTAAGGSLTRSGPPPIPKDVVGLDQEVKRLLSIRNSENYYRSSILCIVGMGGIGKTTLASLLYDHAAGAPQFEIRAWVNVSGLFTIKEIFTRLLRELRMEDALDTIGWYEDDFLRVVSRRLKGRPYFIVLDDVWIWDQLEPLLGAFRHAEDNSRLLITSRKHNYYMDFGLYVHEMKFLNDSQSWELFVKKVCTGDRKFPNHLEKIGRQIVKKCDGLPLAIQEAGRKLSEMTESESVWEEFLGSMDLSETYASLELSYHRLTEGMKPCFSSLGFFKEGKTIRVGKLVEIWVAGGMDYLRDEVNTRLSNLVEEYLVQVKDMSKDNRIKNFDINYNVYRLAVKKAEEELMFEVITMKGSNYQSSSPPRHRAICCSREKLSHFTNEGKHLLSLFFRGGGNCDFRSPYYWWELKSLVILDFEDFGLKTLPEMVGSLTNLKYLELRNNILKELPQSLGKMTDLEVLDISQNFMVDVPNIIWKMFSLRHLYMSDIICREPLKMDKLYNLRTLTYISFENWTYNLSSLRVMGSLRKLGIEEVDGNSPFLSKFFASLDEMKKLEHLILRGFRFKRMPELQELRILHGLKQLKLDGLLTKLPSAKDFPPNVEYLSLCHSRLDKDPMPTLGKLPNLCYLKLRNAYIGKQMVISSHRFEKLETLCFEELWHLRSFRIGEGAMWRLKLLEFKSCPYLKTLPLEIGLMKNLKELKMVTTKDIAAKIRESSFISKIQQVDIQP